MIENFGSRFGGTDESTLEDLLPDTTTDRETGPARTVAGPGNAPFIAAGVAMGGAVLFAGWGFGQMASSDDGLWGSLTGRGGNEPLAAAPATPGPDEDPAGTESEDGEVTVTLPDADGNGEADVLEEREKAGTRPDQDQTDDGSGTDHEDDPGGPDDHPELPPVVREDGYTMVIEWGDTLSEIALETGVPVEDLARTNRIQDPDLIFAGSSLLIPPR